MFAGGILGAEERVSLTLYTDAHVVHGTIVTRQHRVTDILNHAEDGFLVLSDTTFEAFGGGSTITSSFAQINLGAVLFAVADTAVQAVPELRTPKLPELALITIPPFMVTGRIHLLPERSLRDALSELVGRFVPVTEATYWSETLGAARVEATMVAVNHSRAQILAPYVAG